MHWDFHRRSVGELIVRFQNDTGVTRVLYNSGGYLTGPARGADLPELARSFVSSNATLLGLTSGDVVEYLISDDVATEVSGARRIYMQQMHEGLPVYNALMQVNFNRDGRIISVNNTYLANLKTSINASSAGIDAQDAVTRAMRDAGISGGVIQVSRPTGPQQATILRRNSLGAEQEQDDIIAQLVLLPIRRDMARLVWNFQLPTDDSMHHYDYNVDAVSGQIWTRFDWVVNDSYQVYPVPVESPIHTSPAPPADGRQTVGNPNPGISPLGWHDTGSTQYTITRGNNVHAYEDQSSSGSGSSPDCGPNRDCIFPVDFTQDPTTYTDAAIANLFYWNNIIHDVAYNYGFDEAGGNFQVNNFGNGGAGNDDVRAEGQDGGGTNNANFFTPADGSRPRMQMFLWTTTNPRRDGDFDNGIIVHEYGHGISIRLVGGPSNVSCLNNTQQPGEGLSDWWSLFFTGEVGDSGTDTRGVGAYALGQAPDGPGIRTQPYSTDPAVNNHTYESIRNAAVPHGVGEVWGQVAWEAYWALVDIYGFDANLYDAMGGAGNQRMMLYVMEGLKNTVCSPTFADVRDGIIQAATDNYGGADVCTLWSVFAAFGLGVDANDASSSSRNVTNGFAVPAACQCSPQPIADAGPDSTICLGDSVTLGTPAQPGNTYSWSPGGQTTAQITVSPSSNTTYTVTATTSCGSSNDSVNVVVDDGSGGGLSDDFEGDTSGWTTSGLWHLVNNTSCAPAGGSATHAFYYGQDSSCDYNTGAATSGDLTSPSIGGINSSSTLSFNYYRVVESFNGDFDRTTVDIVTSSGSTTVFSLNSSNASTAAWTSSGNIDLSSFAGQTIQVRFRFDSGDGVANNFTGWLIDDVVVSAQSNCNPGNTPPTANISAPADGTSVASGTSISFAGSANDTEDGNISGSLSWTSSIDGNIGSGASFNATLSDGTHTITASGNR